MKIRANLYINERSSSLVLFPVLSETTEHLVMKLAAALLFTDSAPIVSPSTQHPALRDQDFVPDLMALNTAGELILWVECGKTTPHKLSKVSKRFRQARVIVLTALPREAQQMAETLDTEAIARVQVWTFREGEFARWSALIGEANELIGEAAETSLNLVLNDQPFITELQKIRT